MSAAAKVRRVRIAQVAPPFETVPPERYGGTERVVATLTDELVRRGHQVTLIGPAGSGTSARLIPTVDKALWLQDPRPTDLAPAWSLTLDRLCEHLDEFDLVHSHVDRIGFPIARASKVPIVSTLHWRIDQPRERQALESFIDVPLVAISEAQRRPVPQANWVGVVHHGIDVGEFTFSPTAGDYLAFLGRVSPEKGLDTAINVARRAGFRLMIAAREPLDTALDPGARRDTEYFEQVVKPLLRHGGAEMIGQVNRAQRDELLRNAAALLFPIRWPEPFGLVMIEAFACGTPVIALRAGSVPEVVTHDVTGFVCDTEDELVAAVERLDRIDRAACRQAAERRFSASALANRYERVYRRLLDGSFAAPEAPDELSPE
ncbi:MAG TPA: glycosyltransferase family 4 protein [Chloroflexota bacterium]